eukprot:Gb_07130 [translate_table: standard]
MEGGQKESTTKEDLENKFGEYGTITNAIVMRDAEGKSKCFGFVNFENPEDATRVVESLNGKKFDEKESINDDKPKELFSEFGTITSCKVMRNPHGQRRVSSFIAFSSPEEASQEIVGMNGKMVANKPLYVANAWCKEERRARLPNQFAQLRSPVGMQPTVATSMPMYPNGIASNQFASTSLYVGDLEANVFEAQIYDFFKQVGVEVSIRVCKDLIARRYLNYAYVNYDTAQEVLRALEILNFTPINEKPIGIMHSPRDLVTTKAKLLTFSLRIYIKG